MGILERGGATAEVVSCLKAEPTRDLTRSICSVLVDVYALASYADLKTVAAKCSSVVDVISVGPFSYSPSRRPMEKATLIAARPSRCSSGSWVRSCCSGLRASSQSRKRVNRFLPTTVRCWPARSPDQIIV